MPLTNENVSEQLIMPVPKRVVDFSTLAIGGSGSLILADRVDVAWWREVTLLVNVFSHTLAGGSGSIAINAISQSWTPEDPGLEFVGGTPSWGPATIASGTVFGAYLSVPLPLSTGLHPLGHMTRIVASATRAAAGTLMAAISVELSLKDIPG